MASIEGEPSRVSVPTAANPESPRNGNHNLESEKASLSAAERKNLIHAGRVLGRLENGHNTTPVRHAAYTLLRDGKISPAGKLGQRLMSDLVESWRHLGPVPDDDSSALDTNYQAPNTHKKD